MLVVLKATDTTSFTGSLPQQKTPNLYLSHRAMTLKKSLSHSRLNMTSSQKAGPIEAPTGIDLNTDHLESKLSSPAAVSPSSDLETHKRGKRYVLYHFLTYQTSQTRENIQLCHHLTL